MFLANLLQIFKISSSFLKLHVLGSTFNLKLILRKKTVLNSITALKRYVKASLKVFINEKKFW